MHNLSGINFSSFFKLEIRKYVEIWIHFDKFKTSKFLDLNLMSDWHKANIQQ